MLKLVLSIVVVLECLVVLDGSLAWGFVIVWGMCVLELLQASSATSTLPSHQVEANFFWNRETHALSFLGYSVLLVIPSLCSGTYSFLKLVSTRCLSSAYTLIQSLLICATTFLLLDLGRHAAATTTDTCYPAVSSWLEQLSSFIGVPCTLCNQWVQYDSCSHFCCAFWLRHMENMPMR